jgi:plastocyanin
MQFIKKGVFSLSVALALWPLALSAASLQVQVRDGNGHAVFDAVVYAEPETPAAPAKPVAGIEIEQKERKFLPLVTVIQSGSQISFPNNDSVRHHIYSFSSAKKFEQKLYNGTAAAPVVFDKAGTVVLGCNIHDRMLAYIQVVDTPYFGKTDASGKVTLDRLPAGKYSVKVWHYNQTGNAQEQVQQLKQDRQSLEFKLNLKPVVEEKPRAPESDYYYK